MENDTNLVFDIVKVKKQDRDSYKTKIDCSLDCADEGSRTDCRLIESNEQFEIGMKPTVEQIYTNKKINENNSVQDGQDNMSSSSTSARSSINCESSKTDIEVQNYTKTGIHPSPILKNKLNIDVKTAFGENQLNNKANTLSYKRRLPSAGTPAITKATSRFNFEATESSESDNSDCVESYSKKRAHSELLGEKNKSSCTGLDEESKDEISELLSRVSDNRRASDIALNSRSCKQLNEENSFSYKPEKNKSVSSQRKSIRSFRKRMYSRKTSSQNVQQVWALSGWESLARALARVGVEDYLGERDCDNKWKLDFSSILKPPPPPQALMRLVTEDVQGLHTQEEIVSGLLSRTLFAVNLKDFFITSILNF